MATSRNLCSSSSLSTSARVEVLMVRAGRLALADWEVVAFCFQDSRDCVNAWDGGREVEGWMEERGRE